MDALFGGKAKTATRKRAPAKGAAKTTGRKAKSAKPAKAAAASPKSTAKSAKTAAAAGKRKAPSPAKKSPTKKAAAKKAPVKKATSKKAVSSKASKRAGKAQAKAPKAVSEGGRRARSSETVSYKEASESDSGDLLTDQEESEAELDESSDEEGPHGTKSSELKVDKVRRVCWVGVVWRSLVWDGIRAQRCGSSERAVVELGCRAVVGLAFRGVLLMKHVRVACARCGVGVRVGAHRCFFDGFRPMAFTLCQGRARPVKEPG